MDYEYLNKILRLDPETGYLYYRSTGKRAGEPGPKGYRRFRRRRGSERKEFSESRVVWLLHTKKWPVRYLDHINRDILDNRPSNLRECSPSENMANATLSKRNKSGIRGVSKVPEGWQAAIRANGTSKHLGTFDTPEEAGAAYAKAFYQAYGVWFGDKNSAHLYDL